MHYINRHHRNYNRIQNKQVGYHFFMNRYLLLKIDDLLFDDIYYKDIRGYRNNESQT